MNAIEPGQTFTIPGDPSKAVFVVISVTDDVVSYTIQGNAGAPLMRLSPLLFSRMFVATA